MAEAPAVAVAVVEEPVVARCRGCGGPESTPSKRLCCQGYGRDSDTALLDAWGVKALFEKLPTPE